MCVCVCVSGDFMSESRVYEDLLDMNGLKKFMETQLKNYNLTPGVVPMSLVLFRDAINHGASENTTHTHPCAPLNRHASVPSAPHSSQFITLPQSI